MYENQTPPISFSAQQANVIGEMEYCSKITKQARLINLNSAGALLQTGPITKGDTDNRGNEAHDRNHWHRRVAVSYQSVKEDLKMGYVSCEPSIA